VLLSGRLTDFSPGKIKAAMIDEVVRSYVLTLSLLCAASEKRDARAAVGLTLLLSFCPI
jgi:hypothetical protein